MLKRKPKKRRIPNPLKTSTRSAVKKGPSRDEKHLARVREQPCMVCFARDVQAHHCRHLSPRSMGVRVSDLLTVPLCIRCHATLHTMKEENYWRIQWVLHGERTNPQTWIDHFAYENRIAAADGVTVGSPKVREL